MSISRQLLFLTLTMAAFVVAGLVYWLPLVSTSMAWALTGYAGFAGVVLWSFWRRRNWARWLILVAVCCIVLPNAALGLVAQSLVAMGMDERLTPTWSVMVLAEGCLGLYLLYWLNTRSVKEQFRRNRVSEQDAATDVATHAN